jgi:5'-phosphate synthase pdxT subunit
MKIGVLAVQGDFKEHISMLRMCNVKAREVRLPSDFEDIDGLILPGGESTAIENFIKKYGLAKKIKEKHSRGMPVFGTCAGAIVMAKKIINNSDSKAGLGLLNIGVRRNAYGRQIDSFEADIEINTLGTFKGVFIRAPVIENIYNGVEVLSEFEGKAVLVKNGNALAATFHPELTDDARVHKYFVEIARQSH